MTTPIGGAGAGEVAGAVLSMLGLTFDDVLLIPQYSEILPGDASVARFSYGANTARVARIEGEVGRQRLEPRGFLVVGIGLGHPAGLPQGEREV